MTKTINRIEWFGKMDGIIVDLESLMGTDDALNNISNKKDFFQNHIVMKKAKYGSVGLTGPPTVSYIRQNYFCHFVKLKTFQMGVLTTNCLT